MTFNMIVSGVGGQGVILVSRIIAEAAMQEGLDVKVSETRGMAQRGAAVTTHLRMGEKVDSMLIASGEADLLLSLEPMEALRNIKYLKKDGRIVTSRNPVYVKGYPPIKKILGELKRYDAKTVDSEGISRRAGDPITINMAVLGAAAEIIPLKKKEIEKIMIEKTKDNAAHNLKAFELGAKE